MMSTFCGGCGENQQLNALGNRFTGHQTREGTPCLGSPDIPIESAAEAAALSSIEKLGEALRETEARLRRFGLIFRLINLLGERVTVPAALPASDDRVGELHSVEVTADDVIAVIWDRASVIRAKGVRASLVRRESPTREAK